MVKTLSWYEKQNHFEKKLLWVNEYFSFWKDNGKCYKASIVETTDKRRSYFVSEPNFHITKE